jgi:hypothetical protein
VDQGDFAGVINVRMCIGGIWHAVRGPAGVADANDGRGFCFGQDFLQICDSSAGFIDFELIVV